ncbi:MAG TPA: D-aminoacylase [Gemmatimonadaceae bacterium]|nr:D-aminoacylase [Gemmatimonadaceae bacterium]
MELSTRRLVVALALSLGGCAKPPAYDVVIRGGTIYNGTGSAPIYGDLAIVGDSIVAVGHVSGTGRREIDAKGLAVAPGFINMLSQANESLLQDGRSQSDIRQGVTLEVTGEGGSAGPLTDTMRTVFTGLQGDIKYPMNWTTLGGYLDTVVAHGISTNIASFVGAETIRIHELGWDNRAPTPEELDRMRALVKQAMEEGAMGVSTALIYAPGAYAKTDEVTELVKAAAPYGGMYISHMRSEGLRLVQAVDELLQIARDAGVRAEIFHLKAAGRANWSKMDAVVKKIDSARDAGMDITADIYPYPAGATGLDASMPTWVQEGGYAAWAKRLQDKSIRARVKREMDTPSDAWENLFLAAGSPDRILLVQFKADSLKQYTGKTLAEVAKLRGTSPEETAMDLVVKDGTRVGTIYFLMSEDNITREVSLPWVSVGSDEASLAPEGVFLKSNPHPRAYGSFARFLGKYSRDDKIIPLTEAVRRLTSLPATNLRIRRRGKLAPGYFADVVVFNADSIIDHATFEKPHQYATGVVHVFVNGVQVLANGEHTGAKPGRVVRGPGFKGGASAGLGNRGTVEQRNGGTGGQGGR